MSTIFLTSSPLLLVDYDAAATAVQKTACRAAAAYAAFDAAIATTAAAAASAVLLLSCCCAAAAVTPLDAARVNRTIFHNHSVHRYYITLIKGRDYIRYSSCRYNERQLIDVTVVRRVRPRAERWCDCEGHRRWKRAGSTLFCN